ncbi:MAG TPA: outer membrane beta-barrel protein, partial [Bacteroidia bacterium]|nr:outer membrane beta-barrel protein [Bacteroidia bacterium]
SQVEKSKNASAKTDGGNIPNDSGNINKNIIEDRGLVKQTSLNNPDSAKAEVNKGNLLNSKENTTVSKKAAQVSTVKTIGNKPLYIASNSPAIRKKTFSAQSNNIKAEDNSSSSKLLEQKEIAAKENTKSIAQASPTDQKQNAPIKTDSENKDVKKVPVSNDSVAETESLIVSTVPTPTNDQTEIKPTIQDTDSSAAKANQADTSLKPKTDSTRLVKKDSVAPQNKIPVPDSIQKPNTKTNISKDTTKPRKAGPNFFSLSIYGSPELGNNAVNMNNTGFDIKSEKNNLQFAAGLRASFNLGSRIEISIGAAYSQASINYQSNQGLYFDRYATQPYIFSSSYGDMSVPQATMLQGFSPLAPPSLTKFMLHGYQYSQTIQFLNIPINLRFNITTGKLKTYVALGLNIQYAIVEKAEVDLIKELEIDAVKYNSLNTTKLNYAPNATIGAEYDFAKHFGVFLEPNARYNLMSSSTNTAVKSNASFVGCALGLRMNL